MSDVVFIFLMIGVAHWCAHLIQCRGCRANFETIADFLFEGGLQVFGWPVLLIKYLRQKTSVKDLIIKKMEEEGVSDIGVLEFSQKDGETLGEFLKRAQAEAAKEIAKKNEKQDKTS